MKRWLWVLWLVPIWANAPSNYASIERKLSAIEKGSLAPGARVVLTSAELNAYVARQAALAAPGAVRNTRLELGSGTAAGSALVNFLKLRQTQGEGPGWLATRLLDGERPVRVTARIDSGQGKARVKVERVEISGVAIEGAVLDFIVEHYLRPTYPDVKIDEPFELGYRIERLVIRPPAVDVIIGR